jgi:hypothetical protein
MWVIAAAPALRVLFALVTEVGNIWLARIELSNAVEAAALAGAQAWGDAPADNYASRVNARNRALDFSQLNWVHGQPPVTALNNNGSGLDNDDNNNQSCAGSVILLGSLSAAGILDTTASNPIPPDQRACRVDATTQVKPLWGAILCGPTTVQNSATAKFDSASQTPRLACVNSMVCP